jgi:hypothetical protein
MAADYVLVVASPSCRAAGDGIVGSRTNPGMQSEMSVLRDLVAGDRETWLPKTLPVVLPGRSTTEIPLFLQPNIADRYKVDGFTITGAEGLLRTITGQPAHRRPQLARALPDLPTQSD